MKTQCLNVLPAWAVLALLACLPAFSQNPSQFSNPDDGIACRRQAPIPVALGPGQPANFTVSGELCATEQELSNGTTVQLLIHGATYNHDYWDFGKINGIRYSYARDIAARGFPAFAADLIGTGDSSHPASNLLTMQSVAFVAHQVVQGLRDGSIAGTQFGKVIIMGHSLGFVVVWEEAANYGDVGGVIVTGAAHSVTTRFLNAGALFPAIEDTKFAGSGLDGGYLTTIPGTRAELFYSAPDFDPAVLAADDERKDVVPAAELVTGLPVVTSAATLAIQVPVLTILGSNDFTTCGPSPQGANFDCSSGAIVATQDAPFYSPAARIHACVVPGSGHDLSLAFNHELQVADAAAWSFAFVGQRRINEGRDDDAAGESNEGLAWNDGLPWNCGSASK